MKTAFRKSFKRDLKKLKDRNIRERVKELIARIKQIKELDQIPHLKKIRGSDDYHRIRIGDYRVGIAVEDGKVVFVRVGHRRDIYRGFP